MTTTAEKDGDEYVIDGGKLWISNGSVADTVTLFAKTDPEAGNKGISSFIVRPDEDDGFHVEGTEDKLGDKGCPTAEFRFSEMRIPEDRRLGEEGRGFVHALKTLNGGRITIAARGVGIAQAALDAALDYAQDSEQFGQSISEFQTIQHKLADMDTKVSAARLLMHQAADLQDPRGGLPEGGLTGQTLRQRSESGSRERGRPDSRRVRLHQGLPGRALLPRRQTQRDLRRHERSPP